MMMTMMLLLMMIKTIVRKLQLVAILKEEPFASAFGKKRKERQSNRMKKNGKSESTSHCHIKPGAMRVLL